MVKRGLATCPWCPWQETIEADDVTTVVERAREVIDAHNAEVGHRTKAGRKPRLGYRQGKPVS